MNVEEVYKKLYQRDLVCRGGLIFFFNVRLELYCSHGEFKLETISTMLENVPPYSRRDPPPRFVFQESREDPRVGKTVLKVSRSSY